MPHVTQSLFQQVENLEIICEIQNYFPDSITQRQIQTILEFVPKVFPENCENLDNYNKFTLQQQKAYQKIAREGFFPCPDHVIQKVIKLALEFRKCCSELKKTPSQHT